MALEQKLRMGLSQRLVMTPSLQQAIKLLQMSKLDLVEEVQQEMLENPVLEEAQVEPAPNEKVEKETTNEGEDAKDDPFSDIDVEAYFADEEASYTPRTQREIGEELPAIDATFAQQPDLADHLTWQLDLTVSDETIKEIGRAIVGNVNEDGFLSASREEIRRIGDWTPEQVDQTVELIQTFDPVGVAAANLRECLLLQLRQLGEEDSAAWKIVVDHMDKLENRKFKELSATLEIDMEDLEAEVEIIRHLDPRPGRKYNNDRSTYVEPDVYVVKVDDEYEIQLNEEGLPRLRVSPTYRRMIARGNGDAAPADAKDYVRNKLRSALRLIKSLEERQRTIYKVAQSIVKFQREFLDYGIERMRPLVLRDVAEDIEMHESTVSRVVNNKYMHTHRGLFEMRFFFHSGIATTRGGENVSSLTVKERIRKIVQEEDTAKPLSDSAIVKRLKADGLKIARRTVAKYREEMKIPSSTHRKPMF